MRSLRKMASGGLTAAQQKQLQADAAAANYGQLFSQANQYGVLGNLENASGWTGYGLQDPSSAAQFQSLYQAFDPYEKKITGTPAIGASGYQGTSAGTDNVTWGNPSNWSSDALANWNAAQRAGTVSSNDAMLAAANRQIAASPTLQAMVARGGAGPQGGGGGPGERAQQNLLTDAPNLGTFMGQDNTALAANRASNRGIGAVALTALAGLGGGALAGAADAGAAGGTGAGAGAGYAPVTDQSLQYGDLMASNDATVPGAVSTDAPASGALANTATSYGGADIGTIAPPDLGTAATPNIGSAAYGSGLSQYMPKNLVSGALQDQGVNPTVANLAGNAAQGAGSSAIRGQNPAVGAISGLGSGVGGDVAGPIGSTVGGDVAGAAAAGALGSNNMSSSSGGGGILSSLGNMLGNATPQQVMSILGLVSAMSGGQNNNRPPPLPSVGGPYGATSNTLPALQTRTPTPGLSSLNPASWYTYGQQSAAQRPGGGSFFQQPSAPAPSAQPSGALAQQGAAPQQQPPMMMTPGQGLPTGNPGIRPNLNPIHPMLRMQSPMGDQIGRMQSPLRDQMGSPLSQPQLEAMYAPRMPQTPGPIMKEGGHVKAYAFGGGVGGFPRPPMPITATQGMPPAHMPLQRPVGALQRPMGLPARPLGNPFAAHMASGGDVPTSPTIDTPAAISTKQTALAQQEALLQALNNPQVAAALSGAGQGGAMAHGGALGYVAGEGDGREDLIPARLSDGEYVIDAESVAALGNGSNTAGAKKLDEMRANLRKHKGKALAEGKFSPDAKEPAKYLPKGSK